jgi:pterin-4a-carbinolamine dehydratase
MFWEKSKNSSQIEKSVKIEKFVKNWKFIKIEISSKIEKFSGQKKVVKRVAFRLSAYSLAHVWHRDVTMASWRRRERMRKNYVRKKLCETKIYANLEYPKSLENLENLDKIYSIWKI